MKKTGIGLLLLSTTVTVGLAVAVGASLGGGFFDKAVADGNDHSTTITAQEIGAALEAAGPGAKAADFLHEGLTWHVDGATYDSQSGLVNISGGVLYNVTMAGVTSSESGMHGSGFRTYAIYDMDSKTGANSFSFNKEAAMIAEHPIGAISDPKYVCDFSEDNNTEKGYVARFQFAFGAGDGTFFSAIELGYQCEEDAPVPERPNVGVMYGLRDGDKPDAVAHRGEIVMYAYGGDADWSNPVQLENGIQLDNTAGTAFYSTQLFYTLPYAQVGEHFSVSFDLTTSESGTLQFFDDPVVMEAGVTQKIERADFVIPDTGLLMSICMGQWPETIFPSCTVKIENVVIHDLVYDYHYVKFMVDDTKVFSEDVREKCTPYMVPEKPAEPEGQVFVGWFDENDVQLTNEYLITAETTFKAKFEDAGSLNFYDITIYDLEGNKLQVIEDVMEDSKLNVSAIEAPRYTSVLKIYSDAELQNEYDVNAAIKSDLDLYVSFGLTPSATYTDWGSYVIPAANLENLNDGTLHFFNYEAPAHEAKWHIQINFALDEVAAETPVKISFDYKINLAGGQAQVWDGNSHALAELTVADEIQHVEFNFSDGLSYGAKLTFELGGLAPQGSLIDFRLNNVVFTY